MAVYKEINRADGSGVTTFYRISDILDTAETDDKESQSVVIDYNQAQNKPSINGVALVGNKTSENLGLQPAGDYITNNEADEKFIDEDELEAKNYVNQTELQDAIAHIEHFHREIVEALPVTGMDNVLYMVRKGGTGGDIYNEYIWVGLSNSENGYEFLGTTATDLTDYYKKSQIDAALATKVDKEGGKGLSEENYTLAEKTKLAGLKNYDDTEIQAEVSGLNTDINNLKKSNVTISNTLAELKPDVDSNTAAVSTIYDELNKKLKYKGHVNSKEDLPTAGQASGEFIAPNLSVSYLNGGNKSTVQKYYAKKQYFLSQFTNGSNYGVLSTDFPEIVDGVCLGFKPWGTTVFVHLNATGTKTAIIDYDSSNKGMVDYDDGSAWDKTKSTTITKSAWVALYRSPGYEGAFSGNFPNPIKFKIPSKDTFVFANGTDSVDVNYKSLTNNNFTYNSGYKLFEFPSDKDFKWVTTTPSDINENDVYTVGANYDLVRGNAAEQKWEPLAPKSDLYKTYTGYDETKTQVLKNINGTLTWVEETQN